MSRRPSHRWGLAMALTLIAWPTAPAISQGRMAPVNGANLYYEETGTGHPLVLIHGWPMSARMWDDQARELGRRYRVIRYDRRGFGRSPGTPWKESSAGHDTQDLTALLDYLKVQTAYVLGHSQGGGVAVSFTLEHPDRVDALILHGAVPDGMVLPETGPFATLNSVTDLMKQSGMDEFRRQWTAHPINHLPEGTPPEVGQRLALILREYNAADVLTATPPDPGPRKTPAIHRLNTIRKPTLVLVGDVDQPFFQISADILVFEIPGARKVSVAGGGHIVNMIEPERYNAEVSRFLRSVEQAAGR